MGCIFNEPFDSKEKNFWVGLTFLFSPTIPIQNDGKKLSTPIKEKFPTFVLSTGNPIPHGGNSHPF
jgi:hypothetical protein